MSRFKALLIAGLVALSPFSIKAQSLTLHCFECAPEEMANVAYEALLSRGWHAPVGAHSSPAYVVNWYNGTVGKYEAFNNTGPGWNPETDPLEIWVAAMPVESLISNNIAQMRALVPAVMAPPRGSINIPDLSAYNVVDSQQSDTAVANWLMIQGDIGGRAAFRELGAALIPLIDPTTTIKVIFPDGTSVLYAYDLGGSWDDPNSWTRVKDSAKDANGNSIPEGREDYADGGIETYVFNGAGDTMADLFYFRALDMGIIIYSPPQHRFAYVCTEGPNNVITCIVQIM